MKINDLREAFKTSSTEDLQAALVMVYKALPKAKKEELDDDLLQRLKGVKVSSRPKKKEPDFAELKDEVEEFLANAYASNYMAPNREVPKSKRSKWRFEVKRYYKALLMIGPDSPHFEEGSELLLKLYNMLVHACNYYLFNTNDPFASIQVEQNDFFYEAAFRVLFKGVTEEKLKKLYRAIAACGYSYDCIDQLLLGVMMKLLKDQKDQELAYQVCMDLIREFIANMPAKRRSWNTDVYQQERAVQAMNDSALLLSAMLGKAEEQFDLYFKYDPETDKEHTLYKAFYINFHGFGMKKEMLSVYDYACRKYHVKPREELEELYKKTKEELKG